MTCYLGLGRTSIQPAEEYERKSVGTESTFRDMSDPVQLRDKLRSTAEELEVDMKRAEVKGRTLVLKIKLHTYEVFTRQVVPPKAVCLADDLYNYSLPMLVKLEQEIPGMKLRLMGLRCTHLVSTEKPDVMAFFGLKPRRTESAGSGDEHGGRSRSKSISRNDEWEQWPEDDKPGTDNEASPESREDSGTAFRRHGKEILPNPTPKKEESVPEEEWWDCPICSRPQAANERQFNEHIDLCLSRQAIRDTVQEAAVSSTMSTATTPESKRPRSVGEKKRGRPAHARGPDPRQKKLCFG
jgi:DNA polymerase kappa